MLTESTHLFSTAKMKITLRTGYQFNLHPLTNSTLVLSILCCPISTSSWTSGVDYSGNCLLSLCLSPFSSQINCNTERYQQSMMSLNSKLDPLMVPNCPFNQSPRDVTISHQSNLLSAINWPFTEILSVWSRDSELRFDLDTIERSSESNWDTRPH